MSGDPRDMTGMWHGAYAYPAYRGPTTPFVANLVETGGSLSGTILEPNMMSHESDELEAVIAGARAGDAVDFIKTYNGTGDVAHSVDYVGKLSAGGATVTGVWSLGPLDGTFEMHRDISLVAPIEREEATVLPIAPRPEAVPAEPYQARAATERDAARNRSTRARTAATHPCRAG